MVLKASGAFSNMPSAPPKRPPRARSGEAILSQRCPLFSLFLLLFVDLILHDLARPENEDSAWRDGHFFSRLGIAPKASGFLPDHEGAERRKLDRVAHDERIGHEIQN